MILQIGQNILYTALAEYCKNSPRRWVIITDSTVAPLFGQRLQDFLQIDMITFPAGEAYKTRETKQQLEDQLLERHYGRDTGLIALGGGVVSDMVGFLASTYCRGIPVIYAPTTLLAMVDASIGGKTGVDTPFGKNLIGAFCSPKAVFMDINTLQSLPEKEWRDGIVETLKHGLITDAALVQELQENTKDFTLKPEWQLDVITKSVAIKQNIVKQDEQDHGIRQLLNFGHTIGHAIETIEEYQISHGQAVAIGMLVEAYLSVLSGFLDKSVVAQIENILRLYQLPLKTSAFHNLSQFKKTMGLDKKAEKNIPHFVLLDAIGKVHESDKQYTFAVDAKLLDEVLNWASTHFA